MVQINFQKMAQNYCSLTIKGHAQAGAKGQDLVCAALTGIIFGALNAFEQQFPLAFQNQVLKNTVVIQVLQPSAETNLLMAMLITQLTTVAVQYPQNVKIMEVT